ncbi:uncharacterized protein J3R85_012244 [Psidium guajava]|nr:uncharacterized protein J3R85_012244 [Psidium guajava]
MVDGTSETLVPHEGPVMKAWNCLVGLFSRFVSGIWRFLKKAWNLGVDDPRKVVHCLKVGMALSVVSLFYYMRPLYEGVGGNAMWAVMTVVVVFEQTVGATIAKCTNRVCGTFLAGFLGIGVDWVADRSGEKFEPLIIGASLFLLASAATFSRFIPAVKARFDYGAMIFILTFSLVSVSGYRVDELFALAHQRISTIVVGTALCMTVSSLVCPIWAGTELHNLILRNLDKLSCSLEGCAIEYFDGSTEGGKNEPIKNLQGYKCALTSKAIEETMANFARWEPAHGRFNFRHPWKQYLKVGASIRRCAYCVEALYGCIYSETQSPESIKSHLASTCLRVSSKSSNVIKEVAKAIKATRKSSTTDFVVGEMDDAVKDLQSCLADLPNLLLPLPSPEVSGTESEKAERSATSSAPTPLLDVVPLVTLASLLIEIAGRIKGVVDEVEGLAELAKFKPAVHEKLKDGQPTSRIAPQKQNEEGTEKALERV